MIDKSKQIRDASTIIILRDRETRPRVLMGQRGAAAAFMPNKFVFPGGAVDAGDARIPLAALPDPVCTARLCEDCTGPAPAALATAAIRELWEETGQILGIPGAWDQPAPEDWQRYAATGHRPSAEALNFVFRAITPPGRPRRFDARFFMLDCDALASDPDDFSAASDELSHLHWVALDEARSLDLPFITSVVLAEIDGLVTHRGPPPNVPFFKNDDEESLFLRLTGEALTD